MLTFITYVLLFAFIVAGIYTAIVLIVDPLAPKWPKHKEIMNEKVKITPEILINLGFIHRPNLIQESWEYVLTDVIFPKTFESDTVGYAYRSISLAICNDKGKGEYYVFLRDGNSNIRHDDEIITITKNMIYKSELVQLLKILKL